MPERPSTRRLESSIDVHIDELTDIVGRWQQDAHASGVPPHITLLYPWRPAPLNKQDIAEVAQAVAGITPFEANIVGVDTFDVGVLHLVVEPYERLRELMEACWESFPRYPPYGGRVPDPKPHITVAKRPPGPALEETRRDVERALASSLPLRFMVDAVSLMQEERNESWTTIARVPLTPSPSMAARN